MLDLKGSAAGRVLIVAHTHLPTRPAPADRAQQHSRDGRRRTQANLCHAAGGQCTGVDDARRATDRPQGAFDGMQKALASARDEAAWLLEGTVCWKRSRRKRFTCALPSSRCHGKPIRRGTRLCTDSLRAWLQNVRRGIRIAERRPRSGSGSVAPFRRREGNRRRTRTWIRGPEKLHAPHDQTVSYSRELPLAQVVRFDV